MQQACIDGVRAPTLLIACGRFLLNREVTPQKKPEGFPTLSVKSKIKQL